MALPLLLGAGIASFSAILQISNAYRERILSVLDNPPPYTVSGELVSIVIPSFMEEKYIGNLLQSIANQTYQPIEAVVVDGDSTDQTVQICESFGAKVINFPEKNIATARNIGADNSSGDILLFVDADCILEHKYVEDIVNALSENIVLSNGLDVGYELGFSGGVFNIVKLTKERHETSRGYCIRKQDFYSIGGFNEALNPLYGFREDLDIGLKVREMFGIEAIKYLPDTILGTSVRRLDALGAKCGNWAVVVR
jgi:glycosyltransferase involved in cell wall biosynthesis